MGSGKTTVGRMLAKKLNKSFIDSDHEIEARTGASIPLIFEIEGEAGFRQREAEIISELTAREDIVLATGGGAVLDPDSRTYLKSRGTVIYLHANVNHILQRTSHDKNRPLLQIADPRKKIEELSRQREPYYREVAHLVVETGRPNVQSLVQSILTQLQSAKQSEPPSTPEEQRNSPISPQQHMTQHVSTSLSVDLGNRSYPISIGVSLLDDGERFKSHIISAHVAIVTNTTVGPLYLARLAHTLKAIGKKVVTIVLPDGEEEKSWANLMRIFDVLLQEKCDRKTTLIALGGGVIGDMTGFAAAAYMRGIPFIQVPTTLLAQVDSSVGGKTGINHPLGKNMIGAFYQPQAVIADVSTLDTLPPRELSAGLAEVIKHGAIIDTEFFDWIEENIGKLREKNVHALTHAIRRSCEIKAEIVRQDEKEGGLRAILNFGHTFGHAIEAGLGYGEWLHGEAVGCGMVMAADLSMRLGYIDESARTRITALVKAAGLPVVAPDLGLERWIELMEVDKKNEGGQIKFILLQPLGKAIVTTAPQDALLASINACVSK